MTTQSLAVDSFARAETRGGSARSWWPTLFIACLLIGGILLMYARSADAPSEASVMLIFGAGLMALGSALASRTRTAR
jgi:hypothetical protein